MNKLVDLTICHSSIHSSSDSDASAGHSTYRCSREFNLIAKTNVKRMDMRDIIPQIKHLRVDDKALFEQSFSEHYDGMFRYWMTMIQSLSDAEDNFSCVFMGFL